MKKGKKLVPSYAWGFRNSKYFFKGTVVKASSTYPFYSGVKIIFKLEGKELIFYFPDDFGIIHIKIDDKSTKLLWVMRKIKNLK